jgi:ABC-type sugar transport system ATPase subunit
MPESCLEFCDLDKSFGGVRALLGVSFEVAWGEVHALVGENGAGKSTLLKILAGILPPDRGGVWWNGERLAAGDPHEALRRGIGVVYQELHAFPNLSVAANIFAGRELTSRFGRLREGEMRRRAAVLLDRLHLPVSPADRLESLPLAHRQLVQVARALAFDCRLLVLDEPTTSLTGAETDDLFRVLDALRSGGVTVLYVSHRLSEVFRLSDRITVLRDGRHAGTFVTKDTTPGHIVRAMVGRDLPARPPAAPPRPRTPLLSVNGLTRRPHFVDVTLSVGAGEIVGLFGLVGSGRTELVDTLFALHPADGGTVTLAGRTLRARSSRQAARAGIALTPEDRQHQGLLFNLPLGDNLLLPRATMSGRWLVRRAEERRTSGALIEAWGIRAPGPDAMPETLSGGNQQKVILARWLATTPRLLLLDEPTKGVDVGAKYEIHEVIRRQSAGGAGCLVVSSDLPELLAIAHRIVVMREGRVRGEVLALEGEEPVMRLATGEAGDAA